MKHLSLDGVWRIKLPGRARPVQAIVPGCLHSDLMEAGILKDPAYRDNLAAGRVVMEPCATYSREFMLNAIGDDGRVYLCFRGLDTFATISVNDTFVAKTNDMFRRWRFDITPIVHSGMNTVSVSFESPAAAMDAADAASHLPSDLQPEGEPGFMYVRKRRCDFGAPGIPQVTTAGIWQDARIEFATGAVIDSTLLSQRVEGDTAFIDIDASATFFTTPDKPELLVRAITRGTVVAETRAPTSPSGGHITLAIPNARLWWPCGMGEQPLYEINVNLVSGGEILDFSSRRIGIRRFEIAEDDVGDGVRVFRIIVNGRRMLVRGSTWRTPDIFVSRPGRVEYARLVKAAALAGVNMLRVPGYGTIEKDYFYDLCDEYGVCVWQDFMFSDSAYPVHDDTFVQTVSEEASETVQRLSSHACLALWCGGDRISGHVAPASGAGDKAAPLMSRKDYDRMFNGILPDIVSRLAPGTPYIPDSIAEGLIAVADPSATTTAAPASFVTSFGFDTLPSRRRLSDALLPEDMDFASPVLLAHAPKDRLDAVLASSRSLFGETPDFNDSLILGQLSQAISCKALFDRWRRMGPRFGGAFLSSLSDCWPGIDQASLDAGGAWRCLHHFMRRFYANLAVTAVPSVKNGTLDVFVHNDSASPITGRISWHMVDTAGRVWREAGREITVPPGGPRHLGVIKLGDILAKVGQRKLLVFLRLVAQDGFVFASECVRFAKPKDLMLEDPVIRHEARKHDDHSYDVVIDAQKPTPWCWVEFPPCAARCDDNFFPLLPGKPVRIRVTPIENFTLPDFLRALRVRSIRDAMAQARA